MGVRLFLSVYILFMGYQYGAFIICENVKSHHVDTKFNDEFIHWTRENDKDKYIGLSIVQRGK